MIPLGQISGPEGELVKRQCVRQLVGVGELTEDLGERTKGTSNVIVDLDGGRHPTRTKADITQREKELFFLFRAMDQKKQDHRISPDVTLQPGHRHEAFAACSLVGRARDCTYFGIKRN